MSLPSASFAIATFQNPLTSPRPGSLALRMCLCPHTPSPAPRGCCTWSTSWRPRSVCALHCPCPGLSLGVQVPLFLLIADGRRWGVTDSSWGVTDSSWGVTDSSWGVTDSSWGVTDGGWGVTDGGWGVTDGGWGAIDAGWRVTNGGWIVSVSNLFCQGDGGSCFLFFPVPHRRPCPPPPALQCPPTLHCHALPSTLHKGGRGKACVVPRFTHRA